MTPFKLSLIALALTVTLCFYVYMKDRVEKEPKLLLLAMFGAGAVTFLPVYYLQKLVTGLFDLLFDSHIEVSLLGVKSFSSTGAMLVHSLLCAFIGVALIGQAIKWAVLYITTRRNKNFNCLFDGVVYSTFMSLGFAFAEALRYALIDGWDTFISRFITALSAHLFFGVFMGYCFTAWKTRSVACKLEKKMLSDGIITVKKGKKSTGFLVCGLLFSVAVQGAFVLNSYIDSTVSNIIFAIFSVLLYIGGFIGVRFLSSVDGSIENKAKGIAEKWHGMKK